MWLDRQAEEIFATGAAWQEAGDPVAFALIVGVEGSAYRKPGARLAVGKSGKCIGLVSGGCLEQDIIDAADRVQRSGRAEVLEFDTRPEDDILWGWGTGCRGLIHVLVHRPDPDMLGVMHGQLAAGRSALLATVVSSRKEFSPLGAQLLLLEDGTFVGDRTLEPCLRMFAAEWPSKRTMVAVEDTGTLRVVDSFARGGSQAAVGAVLVEQLRPTPRLLIIGAGDDVPPVVDVAIAAGLRTTVVDHRPSLANPLRFPTADRVLVSRPENISDEILREHSAVVVMTHQFEWDRRWLARLHSIPFAYFGVLGPPDRTRRLLEPAELTAGQERDIDDAAAGDVLREREIYGPVGLDIGGEGPGPIAVSIVAQMLAVFHGRDGGHLRDNYERNKRARNGAATNTRT